MRNFLKCIFAIPALIEAVDSQRKALNVVNGLFQTQNRELNSLVEHQKRELGKVAETLSVLKSMENVKVQAFRREEQLHERLDRFEASLTNCLRAVQTFEDKLTALSTKSPTRKAKSLDKPEA